MSAEYVPLMPPKFERWAVEAFLGMLAAARLEVQANYQPEDVCRLFSISFESFDNLVSPKGRPPLLDSIRLTRQRRVPFYSLVKYVEQNLTVATVRNGVLSAKQPGGEDCSE